VAEGKCFTQLALLMLVALFHVGLIKFFVEATLSEFSVGLSHFCSSAGAGKILR
jgi:hypothetical protein